MPNSDKVHFQFLATNLAVSTSGSSTAWEYLEIEGPSDLGPHLESVTSHTRLRSPTAAFEFKCVFMWSIDGSTWSAIMDLTTASGTAGQAISDPYDTVANFGRKMRWALGYRATSGTLVESGNITWGIALDMLT